MRGKDLDGRMGQVYISVMMLFLSALNGYCAGSRSSEDTSVLAEAVHDKRPDQKETLDFINTRTISINMPNKNVKLQVNIPYHLMGSSIDPTSGRVDGKKPRDELPVEL
ncbi:unnamed protein product [Allacma fusca]|uniref:Uncharacterized protein n=1 Tax=Allacma fusca TaxID=39272 RepID=A0A8J2KAR8_9HEXA|nr:unnamed protein product [Allacma fusca]